MNNEQIIQKIKDGNLKPTSKRFFLFRKVSIWFLFALSTMFGAYTFAFFFLKTLYIDFKNWHYLNSSYNMFLIENIPIIWITLFIISIISMFYLFKKTNKGYKHSIFFIASLSIIISLILGICLSKILVQKSVIVEGLERDMIMNWTNPESGRLSGEVLFVDQDYVLLRDIFDNIWNINTSYILENSKEVLGNNPMISMIGRYDYENNFTACQILPFDMDRKRFKPNSMNKIRFDIKKNNDLVEGICNFVINQ